MRRWPACLYLATLIGCSSSSSSPDGGSGDGGNVNAGDGEYFPASAVWYQDVSSADLAANSDDIIQAIVDGGGWGAGQFQIDFSIEVMASDESVEFRSFTPTGDHYTPDCDDDDVPVPAGGALEGEDGYACTSDGDCHLIVVHGPTRTLYEMWRADLSDDEFNGGCLAVWDLDRDYGDVGRGLDCTSADAAGFPIAPLLFSADEVEAGEIAHAIRFILPNDRIRHRMYVAPATHATGAASGGSDAPPYGAHLRLKAGVDISALSPGAQVVAQALKTYGMFLADGGNIALTAQSDRFTAAKWDDLLGPHDLTALEVDDFEVVDHGAPVEWEGNCEREP